MASYHAKKRLGQNFLKSPDIINRIVALSPLSSADTVVEIGSGRGALTLPIAKTGAQVVAIEFDHDLIPYLHKLLGKYDKVRLLNMDFLEFEPHNFDLTQFTLVGNLPYNISSPVLDWCVAQRRHLKLAVLMLQKEVAERVGAQPGGKDWSPLAIFTQLYFKVEKHFDIAASHFTPKPQVASSVITLEPVKEVDMSYPDVFETVVRAAFRQRRKLLSNNLVPTVVGDQHQVIDLFDALGWEKNLRAEELSTEKFLQLTHLLVERKIIEV